MAILKKGFLSILLIVPLKYSHSKRVIQAHSEYETRYLKLINTIYNSIQLQIHSQPIYYIKLIKFD